MFGKSRTLALAVATAGLIGMAAPTMASAATGPTGGDSGGLVNLSHIQVPVQLCNDTVPVNIIGGQVPVNGLVAALGLASPGDTVAQTNTSCHQETAANDNNGSRRAPSSWESYRDQAAVTGMAASAAGTADCATCDMAATDGGPTAVIAKDGTSGDHGGLVNVSDDQIPVQLCNDAIDGNGLGIQVPLQNVAGGLGLLSPGNTNASLDSSCHDSTSQSNNNG
jgi:hypothetical protein